MQDVQPHAPATERRRGGTDGNIPALDGVRAAAALMVVLTHVAFQTGEVGRGAHGAVLARMDFGVALFFALSGFLLYRPWVHWSRGARRRPDVRRYLLRRAVRILPAYWLALVAVLLTTARGTEADDVVRHVTLTQVYGGHLLDGFTQTWSLATEASFYVVLPLLAAGLRRLSGPRAELAGLAGLAAVSPVWAALAADGQLPPLASTWLPGHLDWFVVGMALALLTAEIDARPGGRAARAASELGRYPGTLLALAAAVGWLVATPLAGPRTLEPVSPGEAAVKEVLYAVTAALVVGAAALARPESRPARLLGSPTASYLGRVSYGVFLWHLLALEATMRLLDVEIFSGGFVLVAVPTVALSVLVASASWLLLEQPLLRRLTWQVSSAHGPAHEQAAARHR